MLKYLDKVLNKNADVRESLFRVMLLVGLIVATVALLLGIILNQTLESTLPLVFLMFFMGFALWETVKKRKFEAMAVFIGVLFLCAIFPIMFFASGGIYGGATVWFVLGILYVFMMFTGWKLAVFMILSVITDVLLYIVAYRNPEWIQLFDSEKSVYYDSLFSVLTVGFAVGSIIYYQVLLLKKEQTTILHQKEALERIGKSKDMFFANMGHEIRTPINTIIGLNEMILREKNLSKEVEEDAYYIQQSGKMLLELMNDFLDLSKIESKRMEIVPLKYKVKDVFRDLIGTIQVAAKNKGLKFDVEVNENIPRELWGDEKRIQQVVLNLLTNAVKYTMEGSITLVIDGEVTKEGIFQMKIAVTDTGIGIRKEDVEHLYDAFHRVNEKQNHHIEGSGLGLSISRQLVELMGGEITVDSVYRNGSTFTVIIPQEIVDMKPIGKMDYLESNVSKREIYERQFGASEAKILIVDDNDNNLLIAQKLLRDTRVQIDVAKSGKECLEKTKVKYYHVILLDQMMPEMNGMETLAEVRKQENGMCKDVPIIALTADATLIQENKYQEWGFDGYVSKPIDGIKMEQEILKNLPEEVVEYRYQPEGENGLNSASYKFGRRKKRMIITTDCISDLPAKYVEKFGIKVIHLYVRTSHGSFQDTKEIDSDNLSGYLSDTSSKVAVGSATVEEYEAFYAETLLEAEEVIHVSLAKNVGKCYENAVTAAKGFDHVHVIDSQNASCGEGLLVLMLANYAKMGHTFEEIQKEAERLIGKLRISFLLPSTKIMYKNGFISSFSYNVCNWFDLHPVIGFYHSRMGVLAFRGNTLRNARRSYIRFCLYRKRKRIDKRVLYIVHVGCSVEEQEEILREVKKCIEFEEVIIQKVSISSACNAGIGAIGMSYLMK